MDCNEGQHSVHALEDVDQLSLVLAVCLNPLNARNGRERFWVLMIFSIGMEFRKHCVVIYLSNKSDDLVFSCGGKLVNDLAGQFCVENNLSKSTSQLYVRLVGALTTSASGDSDLDHLDESCK